MLDSLEVFAASSSFWWGGELAGLGNIGEPGLTIAWSFRYRKFLSIKIVLFLAVIRGSCYLTLLLASQHPGGLGGFGLVTLQGGYNSGCQGAR